jgi:hypothetical protein
LGIRQEGFSSAAGDVEGTGVFREGIENLRDVNAKTAIGVIKTDVDVFWANCSTGA